MGRERKTGQSREKGDGRDGGEQVRGEARGHGRPDMKQARQSKRGVTLR